MDANADDVLWATVSELILFSAARFAQPRGTRSWCPARLSPVDRSHPSADGTAVPTPARLKNNWLPDLENLRAW